MAPRAPQRPRDHHRRRARPGRGQCLRRRGRDARPVDGGGRARRRQAGRPRHRSPAPRAGTQTRPAGRGHAVRGPELRLLPARAAHRGAALPRRRAAPQPEGRGDPRLQPGAGGRRGGPLHELRRLQRLRQLLHRLPGRQRDARHPGERPLLDPHHVLQGLPGLRAGMPDRLPGEGAGDGLRRPGGRDPDGDRVRALRRCARRAVGVHQATDRGDDRRVRRRPAAGGPVQRKNHNPSERRFRGDPVTAVHVEGAWSKPPAYGPGLRTPEGERRLAELAGTRKRLNGCASAAFAAGSCGARAFTGSSGVGVTYAYEMYSIISGARIPIQMSIADRTLDPPGDFGSEHTDALCTRDMGWLMGWAATPQEVFDKSLLAYAIGEDPRVLLPQMVVQDGYFVSHISGEVDMPSAEQVDSFLPPYRLPFPLDPRQPLSHGPQIHPSQGPPLQLERARAMEDAIPVIREKTDEFARVFGRQYPHFVEEYMLEDAEIAIVISGGHSVTCRAAINRLRERGVKVGMARLLWVRPFPSPDLRAVLRGVKAVGVVETNLGLGGSTYGGILAPDVTTALYHAENRPLVTSFMAGLGGETVPTAEFEWMAGKLTQAVERGSVEKPAHWVGFE